MWAYKDVGSGSGGGSGGDGFSERGRGRGGGGDYSGRGGYRGGRGRGYRGNRRPNGFGPEVSRFDDELPVGPGLDMTPVDEVEPGRNLYWEWCEKNRAPEVPNEPLKFEKPKTDFHLQVTNFMKEVREERSLFTAPGGRPLDCRGAHGLLEMCQFCDGRRGRWVKNCRPNDPAFLAYQNSIIKSAVDNAGGSSGPASARGTDDPSANTLKLAPVEEFKFQEEDYGAPVELEETDANSPETGNEGAAAVVATENKELVEGAFGLSLDN